MTSSDQGQQINAQTSYLTKYFRRTGACNYTQVVININTFTSAIYATKKPVHHDLICQKHIQALESVLHPRILDNNL